MVSDNPVVRRRTARTSLQTRRYRHEPYDYRTAVLQTSSGVRGNEFHLKGHITESVANESLSPMASGEMAVKRTRSKPARMTLARAVRHWSPRIVVCRSMITFVVSNRLRVTAAKSRPLAATLSHEQTNANGLAILWHRNMGPQLS